jgi:hypothetical protein
MYNHSRWLWIPSLRSGPDEGEDSRDLSGPRSNTRLRAGEGAPGWRR